MLNHISPLHRLSQISGVGSAIITIISIEGHGWLLCEKILNFSLVGVLPLMVNGKFTIPYLMDIYRFMSFPTFYVISR